MSCYGYVYVRLNFITSRIEQATIQGFKNKGYSVEQGENMLRKSVELAREARDIYYTRCKEAQTKETAGDKILKQRQILVAASVGSYGAYLADGSEYRCFDANFLDLISCHCVQCFKPYSDHQLICTR